VGLCFPWSITSARLSLRAVALDDTPLALLTEQLALEPLQLVFELIHLLLRCGQLPASDPPPVQGELSASSKLRTRAAVVEFIT